MDTISQEENEGSFSYLPVLALIIGLIAGVLGGVALVKVSAVNKTISEQSALAGRIDALESQVRTAVTAGEEASKRITKVANDTNSAFGQVGEAIGGIRTDVAALQDSLTKPAPVATPTSSGSDGPAPVAGPDEYVVKSGDTGIKIARNNGVSWGDLQAVNPGVNWNRLGVGQTIKLPQ